MITQKQLKEVLDYDSETGVFIWKKSVSNCHAGDIAGCINDTGYRRIKIDNRRYPAHRLAWLFIHNTFPIGEIDHIDGNRSNNRIKNLRDVSRRGNQSNRKSHRDGRLVGVYKHSSLSKNPWRARIMFGGESIHIGVFPTEEEAHEAYIRKAKQEGVLL